MERQILVIGSAEFIFGAKHIAVHEKAVGLKHASVELLFSICGKSR